MNKESSDLIPLRQMSGRRSKPSMDLLVDNQRILPQYVTPKKEIRYNNIKHTIDNTSLTSEQSSLSVQLKAVSKSYKKQSVIKSKVIHSPKIQSHKRKSLDLNVTDDVKCNVPEVIITNTPYVTLRLNKIDVIDPVTINDLTNKEVDDLPLAKAFPDFKPDSGDAVEVKRMPLVLPPKKKIKFVNINQLNGVLNKPTTLTAFKSSHIAPKLSSENSNPTSEEKTIIVKVLSPTSSQSKIDILTMAKIPKIHKKTKENGSTETELVEKSPLEVVNVTETIPEVPTLVSENSPSSPRIHKEAAHKCVRLKCTNVAIDDFRWDKEFCSPDCAIIHSKYLLKEWVTQHYPEPISEMQI